MRHGTGGTALQVRSRLALWSMRGGDSKHETWVRDLMRTWHPLPDVIRSCDTLVNDHVGHVIGIVFQVWSRP